MSQDDVTVRIFLAGSHTHTWRCAEHDPSIAAVMQALSANGHPRHHPDAATLVRLVVPGADGRERGIVFLRQNLIAVETEPPLPDAMPTIHSARQAWLARQSTGDAVTQRAPYVTLVDVLPPDVHDELLAWMIAHEDDFLKSGVTSRAANAADDYDFRQSRVNMQVARWRPVFEALLGPMIPTLCERLDIEVPERPHLELQMTHHGHLDRFKAHTDNATGTLRQRLISLVYYLHRRPRRFQGGELVLWDRVVDGEGKGRQGEGFRVLEPEDNTLIAFPSHFHHQVRTVRLPEGDFGDGRLTVNGWLRDLDRA